MWILEVPSEISAGANREIRSRAAGTAAATGSRAQSAGRPTLAAKGLARLWSGMYCSVGHCSLCSL
jgi:hypothetical protein